MDPVPVGIDGQLLEAPLDGAQVAQQVRQPLPASFGHEPLVNEVAQLQLDVRHGKGGVELHLALEPLLDLMGEGQHGFYLFGHLHHGVIELGTDKLLERLETGLVPGQAAVLLHELVTATGDTVINQLGHLAEGVEVEPELGLVRQLLLQILDGGWHVEQHQPALARPHQLLLGHRALHQLDGD
ncbi:hypothetical protein D3C86_1237920 [compost metagenome]